MSRGDEIHFKRENCCKSQNKWIGSGGKLERTS